jgi:hypothetical protein
MTDDLRFRRTITIVLEGSPAGVAICNNRMGMHIPEALNFKPPQGSSVRLTISEDWLTPDGHVLTAVELHALISPKSP